MTVAELIAKLQEMPQDARVVVDGYEGGYEDLSDVSTVDIVLNRYEGFPLGRHGDWLHRDGQEPHETAVYLPR